MVVSDRQPIRVGELVIALNQEDILVLRLVPAAGERLELHERGLGIGIDRCSRRHVREHEVGQRIALGVVVGEDEVAVLAQRSAEEPAVLIEVIRGLRPALELVDQIDLVQ